MKRGYIGVVTVLIVSGIALAIAITIALLGSNELIQGFIVDESQDSFQMAEGCAEEAYFRLKQSNSYTGGTIPYADGNCTLSISGTGSNRTITSSFTNNVYTQTITIDVALEENSTTDAKGIDVTQWQQ